MLDPLADTAMAALFIASFLAATVLPGGSEFVLVTLIHRQPESLWWAIAVATFGNTLGGLTSYAIGRLLPNRLQGSVVTALQRYGHWALLLSWLPIAGDALAIGAGWLRLNPWLSAVALAAGKFLRYAAVGVGWAAIERLLGWL
jgi:membrane protein YqaA with SNARE-associated domain